MENLEALRIQKLNELREIETQIVKNKLTSYTEKLKFIKEFILENGPCIDLTVVNAADRILFDENYNFDDVCDPKYVDFIDLAVDSDEDCLFWSDDDSELNAWCCFSVDCKYLTEKSCDFCVDFRKVRNKTEYKDFYSTLKPYNKYDSFETLNKKNEDAKELIDKVYNFIKKYPNAFRTKQQMNCDEDNF